MGFCNDRARRSCAETFCAFKRIFSMLCRAPRDHDVYSFQCLAPALGRVDRPGMDRMV
ncbi:hypothetical protein FH063_000979 [Azospirillum argentinense]|uniref:Uncharacterized protein n=1 Tax=Azospirillum argentinense TaxID=2970906 RepID=A0A5B0L365_9PROT|nr:hypothetical protein FH063_000979 [Azospirillum argentinense]